MLIDTSFDFRTDAGGNDPDIASPTLRRYHQRLWSKPLPGGVLFNLDDHTPGTYLHHRSERGEYWLSSDGITATFIRWSAMASIIGQLPDAEHEAFTTLAYTIGGFLLWPGNQINRKPTINGARGLHPAIKDRIDLTLECVRRHYLDEENPLGTVLQRYGDFFALFEDFPGYVDFWLLQDLVAGDYTKVSFFLPFDDFKPPSAPSDVVTYREYRNRSTEFLTARNARISDLVDDARR